MKFYFVILCMLPSSTVLAASSVSKLSEKLNFTRGVYQAVKGSSPACVSGKFEIFSGEKGALHMSAAESIFASNLHIRKTVSSDDICRIEYHTKVLKKGFVNVETMECQKPNSFYKRTLKMKRKSSSSVEYYLSTVRSKKGKAASIKCRLKLIRKI